MICLFVYVVLREGISFKQKLDNLEVMEDQLTTICLEKAKIIKVGDTRADFNKIFRPDGGVKFIPSFAGGRYVLKDCQVGYQVVKVMIEFQHDGTAAHADDKIISISEPFLSFPIRD